MAAVSGTAVRKRKRIDFETDAARPDPDEEFDPVKEWLNLYVDTFKKDTEFSSDSLVPYDFTSLHHLYWKRQCTATDTVASRIRALLLALAPRMARMVQVEDRHADLVCSKNDMSIEERTHIGVHTLYLACSAVRGQILAAVVLREVCLDLIILQIKRLDTPIQMRYMEVLVAEAVPNVDISMLFRYLMHWVPQLQDASWRVTSTLFLHLCVRRHRDGSIRPPINDASLWSKLLAIESEFRGVAFQEVTDTATLSERELNSLITISMNGYGHIFGVYRSGGALLAMTEARPAALIGPGFRAGLKEDYGSRMLRRFKWPDSP